jgi:hypothetical protein
MAYELANPIKRVAGGPGSTRTLWSYVDGDAFATIDASGYFNLDVARLKIGDVIFCSANGVGGILVVRDNSGTVVDTSNVLTVIDSD